MFLLEVASWIGLSLLLVVLHVAMTHGRHPQARLTVVTGVMWGVTGGLLGTVVRLSRWEMGEFAVLSLLLAGIGTMSFLGLDWMTNHEHRSVRH